MPAKRKLDFSLIADRNRKTIIDSKLRTKKKIIRRLDFSYSIYIYRLLKTIYRDVGISKRAMIVLNDFVRDIFEKLANEASIVVKKEGHKTLSHKHIEAATRLSLPGSLADHAISDARKAMHQYLISRQDPVVNLKTDNTKTN